MILFALFGALHSVHKNVLYSFNFVDNIYSNLGFIIHLKCFEFIPFKTSEKEKVKKEIESMNRYEVSNRHMKALWLVFTSVDREVLNIVDTYKWKICLLQDVVDVHLLIDTIRHMKQEPRLQLWFYWLRDHTSSFEHYSKYNLEDMNDSIKKFVERSLKKNKANSIR